jgi:hypothetical protein
VRTVYGLDLEVASTCFNTYQQHGSPCYMYEEPLTGYSRPVNLASKIPPKEKTTSKEKKKRQKKVRDIQRNRIQSVNPFMDRNLFLESLTAHQRQSTERSSSLNQPPPLPSTQTGDSFSELLRSKHAQGLSLTSSQNRQPIVRRITNNRERRIQSP